MSALPWLLPEPGVDLSALADYRARGGYQTALDAIRTKKPEEVTAIVKDSGLRGRGGAGFPTGLKWTFMPPPDGKARYIACNADESEPGTFKDRQILERNPHQLIEGLLLMGYAISATAAHIYIRGEFAQPYYNLKRALDDAYAAGLVGAGAHGEGRDFHIQITRGAGAYICGEETGLMESVEGKKGQPRKKPPFPAQAGLWARPTTVNNVETISHVPFIVREGAAAFRAVGTEKCPGKTIYGISGHVVRPGTYELPIGVTLRELIYDHAGGIRDGRQLKAVIPGGSSAPVLTADKIDVKADPESLREVKSVLGTGAVIVMDDTTCMVRAAMTVSRFYRHESCGQCTQCREGTGWTDRVIKRIEAGEGTAKDLEVLDDLVRAMDGQTICALADAASWAAGGFLRVFRDEFVRHIEEKRCPFDESFEP